MESGIQFTRVPPKALRALLACGELILEPGDSCLLRTGYSFELPEGYELQIRSRSGLGLQGLTVAHGLGTVDSDYRGVVHVSLRNAGQSAICLRAGDRVAQGVITQTAQVEFELAESLSETKRGEQGHGSTGL